MAKKKVEKKDLEEDQEVAADPFQSLLMEGEEEDAFDKAMRLMLDPANLEHNTDLSDRQVLAVSTLSALATKHELAMLKDFLTHYMSLRVSRGRKGRGEWVQIIRGLHANQPVEQEQNRLRRLLGGRRG